jgi:catechol 2,3-dioxygenase-like lactoylglutathione lyase family enzyme
MPPTLGNGKICYIEIPAIDVHRSADFYRAVFGWQVRTRGDGQTAFDDAVGQVSGTWLLGRPASPTPGLLVYIMVDDMGRPSERLSPTVEKSCSRSGWTHLKLPRASVIRLATCLVFIRSQVAQRGVRGLRKDTLHPAVALVLRRVVIEFR